MHSLDYYFFKTPGIRRFFKWSVGRKIAKFQQTEELRRSQDPQNLMNFEKKVFSQNGEDGILDEIFNRIGTTDKFFVEFGVEDAIECNARYLLEEKQWSGLWIDGSSENVEKAKKQFAQYQVALLDRFIKKENINELFKEGKVPTEFDLLSIDIDGNDYWIWENLKSYRPRVVAIEYNASHLAHEEWVMPYNPDHLFDGSSYFGASLLSLEKLGASLGYKLVGCDSRGVNAFFVREDLLAGKFTHVDSGSSYHYVCPKYRGLSFGHPRGKGPWL